MSRIIIGLGHRARQGKDEVARFLSKKYGFKVVHFSDELYQELYRCHIRYNILSGLIDILSPTIHFNITPTPEIREFIKEKGIPLGNNIEYTECPKKNQFYYNGGEPNSVVNPIRIIGCSLLNRH